jgi:methylated-DNA-protein-cysteine methyltransferase related protein
MSEFSDAVIAVIKKIPKGRVATYAQVAALSGNPRAVRGVVWILHSSSDKAKLPWHRVINSRGVIALRPGCGYEEQRALLEKEGVLVAPYGKIDLKQYQWRA